MGMEAPSDALSLAFADATRMVEVATKAAISSPIQVFGGGYVGADNIGRGTMHAAKHEQLKHNTGHVSTSIRPIAYKIAEQPIRVGRVRRRQQTKNVNGRWSEPRRVSKDSLPAFLKARSDSVEILDNHPFFDSLEHPNDLQVRWQLMCATIFSLMLCGEAYWWIPKVGGKRQIWCMPPDWLTPSNSATEFNATYTLHAPDSFTGDHTLDGKDVIHFYFPDPADPRVPFSPLQALAMSVTAAEHLEESQSRSYTNGLFPALGVYIGDVTNADDEKARPILEESQRNDILDKLRLMHQGSGRYGGAIIFDHLIRDAKFLTHAPKEMAYLESGTHLQGRIEQGMGTNPIINGHVESANRASSTAAGEHFAEWTVNPIIELLSQVLTFRLAPMFGMAKDIMIWIEPFRVKDTERTRQEYALAVQYGITTENEYRENVLGLAPIEGGDVCWISNKMMCVRPNGGLVFGLQMDGTTVGDNKDGKPAPNEQVDEEEELADDMGDEAQDNER